MMKPVFRCLPFLFLFITCNNFALAFEENEPVPLTKRLTMGIKMERLFNSHTSYEFGDPEPPHQAPLSRLEFPLDSWWGGLNFRLSYPRFSLGMEALTNVPDDAYEGRFKDSDWNNYNQKEIYGETWCRINPSYRLKADMDFEVSDWLGLPRWLSIRPLAGMRFQKFHLKAHDGLQYMVLDNRYPPADMMGDVIRFKQTYWQYFMGVRSNVDLSGPTGISDLLLIMQLDWAYVEGHNEDNHLLREGHRFTFEDTYGEAWHGSVALKKGLAKNWVVGFEVDYLTISTTGSHRYLNRPYFTDESWGNGVKVWSEQTSAALTLEYRF